MTIIKLSICHIRVKFLSNSVPQIREENETEIKETLSKKNC